MTYRVLMQRTWKEDRTYLDVEGVIYHYPRAYFDLLVGFERFVYYRPSSGAAKAERSAYVGYGTLAQPYDDPANPNRRFVDIRQYKPIRPVPYADDDGIFFESGFTSRAQRVLAFGRVPSPESRWIGTILQESSIAFVALDRASERIIALNECAVGLELFRAP